MITVTVNLLADLRRYLPRGVDGELAGRDRRLHDGADVLLLSPMEGG